MPSWRVHGPCVGIETFDVVGCDSVPGFIGHVGLATIQGTHGPVSIAAANMGPPLQIGSQFRVDAVGRASLNADEILRIKTFIDRHELEHRSALPFTLKNAPRYYCILPHAAPLRDDNDLVIRTRFSCAGFVYEAYKYAGIILLDENTVPKIGLDRIKLAYPEFATFLDRPQARASLGIVGDGPWPVMFCGYLFHALNRDAAEIRRTSYAVLVGDENFN